MRFSVSSSDLLKQLQIANGAIASNPVLPILEDFLFTIQDNVLTISASDLETRIAIKLDVMSDSDGEVAIPAKILLETLKALPIQPITIAVDMENHGVELTSTYGKYRLAGEPGEDFPSYEDPMTLHQINIPASTLLGGISKTIFATSNDELRAAITGVFFQFMEGNITFVATDAHKLVKYTFDNIKGDVMSSFIMPKKALNLLKNSLHTQNDVEVSFDKTNAYFTFENVRLSCRLLDYKYPDFNSVIPTENPFSLTISRADLLSSLKRIIIYSNKTSNQVLLNLHEGGVTISAQDFDFSNEAMEQMAGNYQGDPLTVSFNAKFLIEMLGVIESEEVILYLSKPSRAGILKPVHQPEGEDLMMLVMPIVLNS